MGNRRKGGRPGTGVELRPGRPSIRIRFTWRGERCCETLDLRQTPANAKYAARLVDEIKARIANGTFRYADFFPESPRAQIGPPIDKSLARYCALFLQSKGRAAAATRNQYALALDFWRKQLGAGRDIDTIGHAELAALIGAHPWPSWKHCNNRLISLRGVFALACKDIKFDNPLTGIRNMRRVKTLPDPLSWDEAEAIMADIRKRHHDQVANYFDFAFLTGMRPEEIIALRWEDVDWHGRTIRVQRARTFKGLTKGIKTEEQRDVDLSARTMAVLDRQKPHTLLQRGDIFHNPVTSKPWHDERSQREHYWNPTLLRLGIRRRRAYSTRHTYATKLLMEGVKPGYVAAQMGHSMQVLFSTYARWIDKADGGGEASKVDGLFGPRLAPNAKGG